MKRILITGMSGTGKTTLTRELARRGYNAVDADSDAYSTWVNVSSQDNDASAGTSVEADRDWVWHEDRIQQLLASVDGDVLFVSGCASNMGQFLPQFDHVVLLSAPAATIIARLATRTTNDYGKRPEEVARVLDLIHQVEPRLRRVATMEMDTSASINDVLDTLIKLA